MDLAARGLQTGRVMDHSLDDFQIFGEKRKQHCEKQGSVIFYSLVMFQMFAECFLVLLELANLKAISIIHMLFLEKEPFLWTRLAPPNR